MSQQISKGDRVRIYCDIYFCEGRVDSAYNAASPGSRTTDWYLEVTADTGSIPGDYPRAVYWKQRIDGGRVVVL